MAGAKSEDESAAGELLNRSRLVSEQVGMAQVDIGDRGAEFDSLGMKSERERASQ